MTLRLMGILIALGVVGCTRVHPKDPDPVGANGCGSPVDCYNKALLVLAETKEYWKQERTTLPLVPTGTVVAFVGQSVPDGWELCDGRSVDRTNAKYKALFDAIGAIHGGDGNPKFNIPDYRGMFLRGTDREGRFDPNASTRTSAATDGSGNRGAALGSRQGDAFANHGHTIRGLRQQAKGGDGFEGAGFHSNSNLESPSTRDYATNGAGGTETCPKNVYVDFIIKL